MLTGSMSSSLLLLLLLGNLGSAQLPLLLPVLGQTLGVVFLHLLTEDHALANLAAVVALALQQGRCDETLDLGGLAPLLVDLPAHDELAHIILLVQVEELADVGGTLGAQPPRAAVIGEARDLLGTLLDDAEAQGREVRADHATTHRLALAATRAALTVARHALLKEQPDAVVAEDA